GSVGQAARKQIGEELGGIAAQRRWLIFAGPRDFVERRNVEIVERRLDGFHADAERFERRLAELLGCNLIDRWPLRARFVRGQPGSKPGRATCVPIGAALSED